VQDNEIKNYFSSNQTIEALKKETNSHIIFYEIDPAIKANIPSNPSKTDSQFGVDAKHVPLVINLANLKKKSKSESYKK
jgi:hypothetical protein